MTALLHETAAPTYTTAGRHRRAVAPGRIMLNVRAVETPEVLVNGFPVTVRGGVTLIQVPAGGIRLEMRYPGARQSRPAEVAFELPEGGLVEVEFIAPRLGFGHGRLQLVRSAA